MEKLKSVPLQETYDEIPAEEKIEIGPDELDDICSLDVDEADKSFFQNHNDRRMVRTILHSLATRNIKDELPISEATFRYKRNLKECERLKVSVYNLLDKKQIDKKKDVALLKDAATFLALERRKARWLEENYFPYVFGKAAASARGEVNQFLIKQINTALLEQFAVNKDVKIHLKDELNYLAEGSDPNSEGIYKGGEIHISIPSYYTEKDEWKIFLICVHELVHHASYQDTERIGIHKKFEDPNQQEINEAVTEIISFFIARNHLEKHKTPLSGENKNLQLTDMCYGDFTHIVKVISAKIPMSLFIDAVLNKEGLARLSEKFDEVFGEKDALVRFAKNIRGLYSPRKN